MKILVVDDESNKLKAIMRVVREIDGIELDSVDITLQLNEAKEKLLNHRYDLMILDLNMPEVLGSDPDKEAGINFIEEVIYVESYKKPRDVIILTAYDELEEKIKENANPSKWVCVTAEKVEVLSKGDLILLIMSDESKATKISNNFNEIK